MCMLVEVVTLQLTVVNEMGKGVEVLMVIVTMRTVVRVFFFSSRRRHTRFDCDWSSDVCSSDLWRRVLAFAGPGYLVAHRLERCDTPRRGSGRSADAATPLRAQRAAAPYPSTGKIGRASCRERV